MHNCVLTSLFRSRLLDLIVTGGWVILVLTGQIILNRHVGWFEWLAVIWISLGILMVRTTSALPLLLLSSPAFMSEMHRPMAWVQTLLAGMLLVRIWIGSGIARKQRWMIFICFLGFAWASWPEDWVELLAEINRYPSSEWFQQFWYARPTWAMFPFRHVFERAIFFSLALAVGLSNNYTSTPRIWRAYAVMGAVMMTAAIGSEVFPWQAPHLFLGTTNYSSWSAWTLCGAGYNVIFLVIPMLAAVPALLIPIYSRNKCLYWGLCGVLLPLPFANQRAALAALAVFFTVLSTRLLLLMLFSKTRKSIIKHYVAPAWRGRKYLLASLVVSSCFSLTWFIKKEILFWSGRQSDTPPVTSINPDPPLNLSANNLATPLHPADESNGKDIWYGNTNIIQGVITFATTHDQWSALPRGTLITISEAALTPESDPADSGITNLSVINVSTLAEATNTHPRVKTISNILNDQGGRIIGGGRGYELTIFDADNSVVFGPIGERIRGWAGGAIGEDQIGSLATHPGQASIAHYTDAKRSSYGLPNRLSDGSCQDLTNMFITPKNVNDNVVLVLNEYSGIPPHRTIRDGDDLLGFLPGNGGHWLEFVVVQDQLDMRGWSLRWAITGNKPLRYDWAIQDQQRIKERLAEPDDRFGRTRRAFKKMDRPRYLMWLIGLNQIKEHHMWSGAGAGTWGRYHKKREPSTQWQQDRDGDLKKVPMVSHPHMHNTLLDLIFEYGLIPMMLVFLAILLAIIRIMLGSVYRRCWLWLILPLSISAMSQFLFYTTSQMVLLTPLVSMVLRALIKHR